MITDTKEKDSVGKGGLDYIDYDANLICTLTTHRLVFLENTLIVGKINDRKSSAACFIPLSLVGCASSKGFGILASPKLKMTTHTYGDINLSFETSGDRDELLTSLSRCLGELFKYNFRFIWSLPPQRDDHGMFLESNFINNFLLPSYFSVNGLIMVDIYL